MIRFKLNYLVVVASSLALVCACQKVHTPPIASRAHLGETLSSASATPAASTFVETQAEADPLRGCEDALLDKAVGSGRILVVTCSTTTDAAIRFIYQDAANTRVRAHKMDSQAYAPTVDVTANLWDNKVVSVRERGGTLVLANWTGKDFLVSTVDYYTGDEELLGMDYKGGAFFLTTRQNGTERLAEATGGAEKGRYRREAISCRIDANGKFTQALDLTVNASGRVNALGYVGMTPQETGALNCSIDADRANGESTWTDENGETVVAFKDDGKDDEPNRITIHSEKGLYTVNFDLKTPGFCGLSSVIATQIKLQSGEATCKSAELSD